MQVVAKIVYLALLRQLRMSALNATGHSTHRTSSGCICKSIGRVTLPALVSDELWFYFHFGQRDTLLNCANKSAVRGDSGRAQTLFSTWRAATALVAEAVTTHGGRYTTSHRPNAACVRT